MRRKKPVNYKLRTLLPVIILFGILAVGSGSYSSGYGTLYLQPTFPHFQRGVATAGFAYGPGVIQPMLLSSSSLGSARFAAGGPIAPTYGPGAGLAMFGYSIYYRPVYAAKPIYTTPTRALVRTDVGYRYSNYA